MVFFIIVFLIFWAMQAVVGLWAYNCFPQLGWKITVCALPLLLTIGTFWIIAYTRNHYGFWENLLYHLAYIWAGFVFIAFSVAFFFAILQAITHFFHFSCKPLLVTLSMGIISVACLSALYCAATPPAVKTLSFSWRQAPSLKLAVISDTHLGIGVSLDKWKKALHRIAQEKPDAILVLGDLFEYGPNRLEYARALAELKTPYGTFGVFGNHEYYTGTENSLEFYQKANITLLNNQIYTLPNTVQLIGVSDITATHTSAEQLSSLLSASSADKLRILLSHQPLLGDVAASHHIPLMLSGHTHKGQIFPFHFLVKLKYKHIYGWYHLPPETNLYVTSGMFYWGMPLRLLAPAEIPIIEIKADD